eukprot:5353636-Prymnesium_polylepis.2
MGPTWHDGFLRTRPTCAALGLVQGLLLAETWLCQPRLLPTSVAPLLRGVCIAMRRSQSSNARCTLRASSEDDLISPAASEPVRSTRQSLPAMPHFAQLHAPRPAACR